MNDSITYLRHLLAISLFCFVFSLSAQNSYKHYTASDGLQHDVTYNIIQDSKGYIWVGTDDGLAKFDGKDFRNYSLKDGLTSNYVMDVEELPNGKYAIATWGGGLHFLENDSIYKNPSFKDTNVKSYDIKYFDDKIYTYSGSGISLYDLQEEYFKTRVYVNEIDDFIDDLKSGITYQKLKPIILNNNVFVHNQEPSKNNFKGIKAFLPNFELQDAFPFLSKIEISSALEIAKTTYVFASNNKLLFSNTTEITNRIEIDDIKPEESIVKVIKTPNSDSVYVLLIRNEKGEKRLLSFDIETKTTIDINKLIDVNAPVSDAMFDFEDNLWVSTYGDGVYCYYYSNPQIKNVLEGKYITDIIKKGTNIYAQTSSQLYKFNNDSIIGITTINGFAKHLSVADHKITVSALGAKNSVASELNIINGRFFAKTKRGYIRQSDTIFVNKIPVLISNELFIKLIRETDSTIDLYTNKGKWIYNFNTEHLLKDPLFEIGLPSEKINDLVIKDSVYYIATDKGLVIKKDNAIKVYTNENGLQNERVNSVLLKDDDLYLGTQSGMSVIKEDKVYNFSKSFGIQSLAINKIIELNGNLWLSGNNGISIINLEDVRVSNSPKLNINQNDNIFNYESISYSDQNAINLQYRINNEDWIATSSSKGVLDFNNYAVGNYSIAFRTQNSHSTWEMSPIYSFTIKPPWYKVWWIVLLGFLMFSGFIGLVFYSRLRLASKRNTALQNEIAKRVIAEIELSEVRDNIARDFHDDLGNKLASISLLSDVLSTKVDAKESKVVKTIKNDADYLYKGTKDFIFSLQERSNYIEEVIIYLSDFAENYLYQFGIDFEVQSNVKTNIKLPYYWSKQIIYIFKEAITNTAKHAEAKNAKMLFSFKNDTLQIQFTDDGKGFNSKQSKLNGITNMQSRAHKIDCLVKIESKIEQGTTITFIGELPH